MKTIIFATGFKKLEAEIMKLLNQPGNSETYQQIGYATHRDNVLAVCRQKKPSVLVIHDELPGRTSFQELIRSLKVEIPGIRIVVITKEREPGDSMLSIMTMYGVYDFISRNEVTPGEIARLIMNPKTFADVEKYAPAIRQEDAERYSFETKLISSSAGGQELDDVSEHAGDIAEEINQSMTAAFSGGVIPEIELEEEDDLPGFAVEMDTESDGKKDCAPEKESSHIGEIYINKNEMNPAEDPLITKEDAQAEQTEMNADDVPLFPEKEDEQLEPEDYHARLEAIIDRYRVENTASSDSPAQMHDNKKEIISDQPGISGMTDKTLMKYISFMESSLKDQMLGSVDSRSGSTDMDECFEKLKYALSEYKKREGVRDPDCSWIKKLFESSVEDPIAVIVAANRPVIYKDGGMIIIPNMQTLPETDRRWLIECLKEGLPPKPPVKKKKSGSAKEKGAAAK